MDLFHPARCIFAVLVAGVRCVEFHLLNKVNPSSGGIAVRQEPDPAELPGSCGYAGSKVICAVRCFQNW